MERLPINYCSHRDLTTVPGIGDALAERIMSLRTVHGDVTADMLADLPYVRNMPDMLDSFDFRPYVSISDKMASDAAPSRMPSVLHAPSASHASRRAVSSDERFCGRPFKFDSPVVASTRLSYPFDRYPPLQLPPDYSTRSQSRDFRQGLEGARMATNDNWHDTPIPTWSTKPACSNWREDTPMHRNPTLPKTITYNGKSSWQAFFSKFTSFADECNWSAKQRKNNLCWCLESKASELYALLSEREPNLEYFDLVKKIEKRFGLRDLPEATQMQFNYARQSPEESILDWADRVIYLATRAFPGLPELHVQKQLVLKFCQGCSDREAGQYAINVRPSNIEEAIYHVRWFKRTQRAIYGRARNEVKQMSCAVDDVSELEADLRKVDINKGMSGSDNYHALEKRMAGLEEKFDSMQGTLDILTSALQYRRSRERSRSPAGDPSKYPCYKCGKPGHFKRDCPSGKTDKTVSFIGDVASNYSGSESEADLRPEQSPADHVQ